MQSTLKPQYTKFLGLLNIIMLIVIFHISSSNYFNIVKLDTYFGIVLSLVGFEVVECWLPSCESEDFCFLLAIFFAFLRWLTFFAGWKPKPSSYDHQKRHNSETQRSLLISLKDQEHNKRSRQIKGFEPGSCAEEIKISSFSEAFDRTGGERLASGSAQGNNGPIKFPRRTASSLSFFFRRFFRWALVSFSGEQFCSLSSSLPEPSKSSRYLQFDTEKFKRFVSVIILKSFFC